MGIGACSQRAMGEHPQLTPSQRLELEPGGLEPSARGAARTSTLAAGEDDQPRTETDQVQRMRDEIRGRLVDEPGILEDQHGGFRQQRRQQASRHLLESLGSKLGSQFGDVGSHRHVGVEREREERQGRFEFRIELEDPLAGARVPAATGSALCSIPSSDLSTSRLAKYGRLAW